MRTLKTNSTKTYQPGQFIRIAGKSYMVDSYWQRPTVEASYATHIANNDQLRLAVEYLSNVVRCLW